MSTVRATVEWMDGRITFEGPEEFVRMEVQRYTAASSKSRYADENTEEYSSVSAAKLIAEKQPKGHHEIVAVLAFSLAGSGVSEFTEDDIKRLYRQARIRPPKVVAQALRDAKNRFDYLENGEKRGSYKLSSHGDRTVRHDLPRVGA